MLLRSENSVWSAEISKGGKVALEIRCAGVRPVQVCATSKAEIVVLADAGMLVRQDGVVTEFRLTVDEPITCLLLLDGSPRQLLVGTEGAHLFTVDLGSGHARRVPAFDRLECRASWNTPWGGPPAVRSLARGEGGWVYADIHVGSIMRSPDLGVNWEPVKPELHRDVHQVATHPEAGDGSARLCANTAHAVYISDDHGDSWRYAGAGLGGRYGRAIALHPGDPDRILASVSDGPHGDNVHGELHVTANGGRSWRKAGGEFPESTTENINTFQVAFDRHGTAWAAVRNRLYVSVDGGAVWHTSWAGPGSIEQISCA